MQGGNRHYFYSRGKNTVHSVESLNQRHSVVVSDPDVPEEVRSLIDWLHDRSEKD
jgi:hypothetical protein